MALCTSTLSFILDQYGWKYVLPGKVWWKSRKPNSNKIYETFHGTHWKVTYGLMKTRLYYESICLNTRKARQGLVTSPTWNFFKKGSNFWKSLWDTWKSQFMVLCRLNILLIKRMKILNTLQHAVEISYIELQWNFSTSLDADCRSPDLQADGQTWPLYKVFFIKSSIFWDITQGSSLKVKWRLGHTCLLHL
jgi:hypothetical protein